MMMNSTTSTTIPTQQQQQQYQQHQQQIPLTRLLTHLEATLSFPSSSSKINSPAHRARISANLEHARALHLTAEKTISQERNSGKREVGLEELRRQREWIGRLEVKLRGMENQDDSESDEEEGEDLLRVYEPARKAFEGAGLDVGGESAVFSSSSSSSSRESSAVEEGIAQQQQQQEQQQQGELRARKGLNGRENSSLASTSAREELFSHRAQQTVQDEKEGVQKTEMLMSHNRTEQEALTTGLLGLASALKQSSINFSSSLEAERDVMKRAEGGLDQSAVGMEAAGKKMGTLRRMSEGQGWWGRIKLYAFIFGLWVACFLLVFIGPKLRF